MNTLSNPADNLTMVERQIGAEREVCPLMPNQLSHEQWAEIKPPLYTKEVNFNNWGKFEWQVCLKWLGRNTTGWWYWNSGNWLTFEKIEDHVLFTMWAKNEPMETKKDIAVL